jgi:hypothetical protein
MSDVYLAATKNASERKSFFLVIVYYSSEHIYILTFVLYMNEEMPVVDLYNRE